jgi:hypothetical protein
MLMIVMSFSKSYRNISKFFKENPLQFANYVVQ